MLLSFFAITKKKYINTPIFTTNLANKKNACANPISKRYCHMIRNINRANFYYILIEASMKQCLVYMLTHCMYMTNPTIVCPVKMEYGWNFSISGLNMMMKSGLEKIFLKFLHALTMSFLLLNLYVWPKLLLSMR